VSAKGCTAARRRTAAIEGAYVEDVSFLDSEAELVGRQASSDRVQKSYANPKGAGYVRFVK
jgi:ABC-type hemin transport system substrate-binding protein